MGYTNDQVSLLRRTLVQGLEDDEFELFIETCDRLGLDPFAKQIYAVKRWDNRAGKKVMAIQVSIDGFRTVAARTGQYEGQDGPFWCGDDGKWVDVWLSDKPPVAAKVGVTRKNFKNYLYGVAKFKEFAQRDKQKNLTSFWKRMPDTMSAKCAEAQALRRAFPELSGIYIPEEMEQEGDYTPSSEPSAPQAQPEEPPPAPPAGNSASTPQYIPPDDEEQPPGPTPTLGPAASRTPPPEPDPGPGKQADQFKASMEAAKTIGELIQIGKGMKGIDLGIERVRLANLYASRRRELQPA